MVAMEFRVFVVILFWTFSLAYSNRTDVRGSCQIPVEAENLRLKFSLVHHSDRLVYKNGNDVFDGDWYFLPGARVQHGMKLRIQCAKDVYGDAIHESYKTKCNNGRWSNKLPNCTDYCKAPLTPGMIMVSGKRLDEQYLSGFRASYDCGPGWYITGSGSLVCESGIWLGEESTCEKYSAPVGLNVVNVTATVFNGSDVRVNWGLENDEEDIVSYFRVLNTPSYTDPPELWNSNKVPNDTFAVTLKHLAHGSVNRISVAAGDGIGEGPLSNIVWIFVRRPVIEQSWHTDVLEEIDENDYDIYGNESSDAFNVSTESPMADPLPSCPENVTTYIHGNDVIVTWDMATSTPVRIHGHFIEYKTGAEPWKQTGYIMADNSLYDLVGLDYGQNYNIRFISLGSDTLRVCDEVNVTTDFAPCSRSSIPEVGTPDISRDNLTSLPHGHGITLSCAYNKKLQGNSTIVCNNGNWSDVRFTCIRYNSCRVKHSRLIMRTFRDVYTHGSKVRFICRWKRGRFRRRFYAKCNDGSWSRKIRRLCALRRG